MAANPFFIESFMSYVPKLAQDFASYTGPGNIQDSGSAAGPSTLQGLLAEYQSTSSFNMTFAIINGLGGSSGASFFMRSNDNNASGYLRHNMPANYGRIRCGFSTMVNGVSVAGGVEFLDGGNVQCAVGVDSIGRVIFTRGSLNGPVATLYTSAAVFLSNIRHYIVCDFTCHGTTGTLDIWLDGVLLTSLTGLDTNTTANNYVNQWQYFLRSSSNGKQAIGDFWIQDNTDAAATITGDRIVDGLLITTDDAVQFSPALSLVGNFHEMLTASTVAPGANQLVLVPVTVLSNRTINNVNIMPRATSATAKFKGVIYGDTAGAPDALLSSGTEVVGCTNGTALQMPLVTPQALVAGTQYWIGYITDTSVAIQIADPYQNIGQRKANTYTSGAPSPTGGGMTTGQSTYGIWGLATGAGVNYDQVNRLPPAMQTSLPVAYNQSGTVGHVDSFNVTDLPVTPTGIDTVQVKVLAMRTDAGARTINIKTKSGATAGNGDSAGITPPTSLQWLSSRFATNPATAAAWTPTEVNGMKAQYEIAS